MHHFISTVEQSTAISYDLTTVAAVNAALNIRSTAESDAIVQAQITACSQIIAAICGRVFASQTVDELFRINRSDWWGDALNLSRWPVTEFDSVKIGGSDQDPNNYEVDKEAGLLYVKCGNWQYMNYNAWPIPSEIVVHYTGGYVLPDEAPACLAQACIALVRDQRTIFKYGGPIRDVTSGDDRVMYFDPLSSSQNKGGSMVGVSPFVEALLSPYRRYAV